MKKKTVYVLRCRRDDSEEWGYPEYYRKQKDRDTNAKVARILGGMRTWSFEEKKTEEDISELCD